MRVVIAPDSFKGSLDARSVAEEIAIGWRQVRPLDELLLLPQADGGEGTLDAIAAAVPGSRFCSAGTVTGPDGRGTAGVWLELPNAVAVVELAQCAGLSLMEHPDALRASTRGLGEVIRAALGAGAQSLVIGLGGSASTDGGAGALCALGLALTDDHGIAIPDGGGALIELAHLDRSQLLTPPSGEITVLTDVTAPLIGATGSAMVFGPQKGASASECAALDTALHHFAQIAGGDPTEPGSGAAGGAGFGFATLWGARLAPGAAYVAALTGLSSASADLVLTGEGHFDSQSLLGKVVGNALTLPVQVGVIAGQISRDSGGWMLALATLAGSIDEALANPRVWLRRAGATAARELA